MSLNLPIAISLIPRQPVPVAGPGEALTAASIIVVAGLYQGHAVPHACR